MRVEVGGASAGIGAGEIRPAGSVVELRKCAGLTQSDTGASDKTE